jgi:isopentenyl diphosphate isomerase/L-lactate dehydrogenase-like FMN-dependent dehydrogenase
MDFYTLDSSSYNIVALLHSNFQELVMRWFHRCDSILASMLVLEHFANLAPWINQISLDDLMCAQDVKWLQTITKLPILVKGVMTAEDSTKSQTLAISLSE